MKFKTQSDAIVINTSKGLVERDPKTVSGNMKDYKNLYKGIDLKPDDLADFTVSFSYNRLQTFVVFDAFGITFAEAYKRTIHNGYKKPKWWQIFTTDSLHIYVSNVHRPKPKLTVVK